MLTRLSHVAAALAIAATLSAQNVVLQWNEAALDAIRASGTNPPAASRQLAILHCAVFDAVNGAQPRYQHYLVPPAAPAPTNRAAAATTAAHDVLVALQPAHTATFDALNSAILATLPNNMGKTNGIAWGASVAQQMLAARQGDGSTAVVPYPGSTAPGAWRPTISFGGIVRPALLPGWGDVTPFGIASVQAYQPPPPPGLLTFQYAFEVWFTRVYGGTVSTARTPDETEIAHFWGYGPGTATPPGHWNQIAQIAATQRNLDLRRSARLFALLNIGLADAAIACWRCKYDVGLWRPITAIQLDGDGNPLTSADPSWTPLLETPPFPEYTSGHSTFSGAAASVLARVLNSDFMLFQVGSDDLPGVYRTYFSFSHAAWESGISRLYGGIHYWSGNLYGLAFGGQIGSDVVQNLLRPL